MDLNLQLNSDLLAEIERHVEQECMSCSLNLSPGSEQRVPAGDTLKKKLEKYIDFEAGGLKLLDLQIQGRPARFLLVPDVGAGKVWLQFQYRF